MTRKPTTYASMHMPKLVVKLPASLIEQLTASAEQLWPGHGQRGVNRLVTDAIKRYGRYSNDRPRARTQRRDH